MDWPGIWVLSPRSFPWDVGSSTEVLSCLPERGHAVIPNILVTKNTWHVSCRGSCDTAPVPCSRSANTSAPEPKPGADPTFNCGKTTENQVFWQILTPLKYSNPGCKAEHVRQYFLDGAFSLDGA